MCIASVRQNRQLSYDLNLGEILTFYGKLHLYSRGWILNLAAYTKEQEDRGAITLFIGPTMAVVERPIRNLLASRRLR